MALYERSFSLVRPCQFYVQIFETRLRRITEIPLYLLLFEHLSEMLVIQIFFLPETKNVASLSWILADFFLFITFYFWKFIFGLICPFGVLAWTNDV